MVFFRSTIPLKKLQLAEKFSLADAEFHLAGDLGGYDVMGFYRVI